MSFSEPGRVVLVAVDPSENSKFAFEYYMRNVHRPDDLIVLTHVPEPPKLPSFSFKGGLNVPSDKWGKILEEANAKTTKLESDYEDMCIHRKLHYKVRGESSKNAGDSICRIADEEGADLIIIGCRGLGRVKRSVMGSVSDYVVRNAQRPVFVIPRHE
jgi:nucleotide-binding universal stress UspA family protein